MTSPGRTRLSTDARREQLLNAGVELLGRRAYDEVSTEDIAEAAGVSVGLLYHYFPTKKDFLLAALEQGERELAEITAPDPQLEPEDQLSASLDRFLDFVEEHEVAYTAIFRSRGGGDPEIRAALDRNRKQRMNALIEALADWDSAPAGIERTPVLETAIQGWFFFVEGAVLHWLERREIRRDDLRDLLTTALLSVIAPSQVA
jgi:AcrR family transcriptional regulator